MNPTRGAMTPEEVQSGAAPQCASSLGGSGGRHQFYPTLGWAPSLLPIVRLKAMTHFTSVSGALEAIGGRFARHQRTVLYRGSRRTAQLTVEVNRSALQRAEGGRRSAKVGTPRRRLPGAAAVPAGGRTWPFACSARQSLIHAAGFGRWQWWMLVVTGCAWITYAAEVRSASHHHAPAALRQLVPPSASGSIPLKLNMAGGLSYILYLARLLPRL